MHRTTVQKGGIPMKHTRKRILSILSAAAMAFCSLPQNMPLLLRPTMTAAAGAPANPVSEFEYTNIGDGIQIKKWNGSGETVVVPSEINGLPVDEISGSAFKNQTLLTKIIIPDSVEAIGQNAFYGCLSLTDINIPDGVTSIEFRAFSNCSALKTLTIPESVTSIGRYAFANSGLTSVTLPQGLTALGEYAFQSCSDLKSIVISDGVAEISDNAFYDCRRLKSVTLPKNLKRIGIYAFAHCGSLNSITLPDGTERIDSSAFQNSGLTEITIPASVTDIGGDSFGGCSISLIIKGYTGSYAEKYANRADIPFEAIAETTVETTTQMTTTTMTTSTTAIQTTTVTTTTEETITTTSTEDSILRDGPYEYTINEDGFVTIEHYSGKEIEVSFPAEINGHPVKYIGSDDIIFSTSLMQFEITSVVIPDGVIGIGDFAFASCESLAKISIPESVVRIGGNAFFRTPWLAAQQEEKTLVIVNHNLIDGTTASGNVSVPNDVRFIAGKAFNYNSDLTAITIPESVTEIGDDAFWNCKQLQTISLSEGQEHIGDTAFAMCYSLKKINIPKSVTSIGEYILNECPEAIIYVTDGTYGAEYVKAHGYRYTSAAQPVDSSECGAEGDNLTWILDIDGNLTITGSGVMINWTSPAKIPWKQYQDEIRQIKLDHGVTSIGIGAFSNCSALSAVSLPDSLCTIGMSAFANCTSLKEITIPATVAEIGDYAFDGCKDLTIEGYKNSAAEKYAAKNSIAFEVIVETTTNTTTTTSTTPKPTTTTTTSSTKPTNTTTTTSTTKLTTTTTTITLTTRPTTTVTTSTTAKPTTTFTTVMTTTITTTVTQIHVDYAPKVTWNDSPMHVGETRRLHVEDPYLRTTVKSAGINCTADVFKYEFDAEKSDLVLTATAPCEKQSFTVSAENCAFTTQLFLTILLAESTETLTGDINGDGTVSVEDAQLALLAYVQTMAGLESGLTEQQALAADINGDHTVSVEDAQIILIYYVSNTLSSQNVTWDELLGKKTQALPRLIKKLNIPLNLK